MGKWLAAGSVAICILLTTGDCTQLRSRTNFFSQLAAGALQGTVSTASPLGAPLMGATSTLLPSGTAGGVPTAPMTVSATGATAQTQEQPQIPAIDAEKAGKLESMQKLLDRKIQQSRELKEKLDDELKFMKEEGLLESGKGAAALQGPQAAPGQKGAIGGMLPDLAAPIIFLEPPPVTQSQTLEAAEVAESTLAMIGDYSSPAMKAVREYELKKLGQISGTNLEQIRKEIRETESAIEKRKKERDTLTQKLKEDGRALAKGGNRQVELEATFANSDLREKSKELDILADKLTQLKTREKDLIKREGPGKGAKEELDKEEGDEDELASEIEGEE